MSFNCGIVGLPNVGKSTLFNALTQTAAAQAANFPFCTIEPNTGRVAVPDARLDQLASLVQPEKTVPTSLEVVDIAGLVAGAHKGEGLGNQFLANIRETDAVLHMVRCFEDDDVTHVNGSVDPLRDIEIIETELQLADLAAVEKRLANVIKKAKSGDADAKTEAELLERLQSILAEGKNARTLADGLHDSELPFYKHLQLLTAKPVLYVCNVAEAEAATGNDHSAAVAYYAAQNACAHVVVSAAIEAEIAQMAEADRAEFLAELGLKQSGLDAILQQGYQLLDLLTYFTAGKKEVRAWTVAKGSSAPEAAGRIHGDMQRGFIKADTIAYDHFVAAGSEAAAKEGGKQRQEGKEYVVQDGDVLHFKFNV